MTLRALSTVGWAPSLCPGCGAAIAYFRCRCPVVQQAVAPVRCWNFEGQDCPPGAACHYPLHCALATIPPFGGA